MTKVFQSPSALACMRTMICATCRKTAPCLGALFTLTSPWPVAVRSVVARPLRSPRGMPGIGAGSTQQDGPNPSLQWPESGASDATGEP